MRGFNAVVSIAVVAATALGLQACGSSSSSSSSTTKASSASSATSKQSRLGDCSQIRSQYPGLPTSIDVAISPYNAELEKVNPQDPSQIEGVEPDLLSLVARCLGFKYNYQSQAFASVIAAVTSGRAEMGLTAIFVTPARAKVFDIVSHMKSVDQVISTPGAAKKIQSVNDLCGLTVAEDVGSAEVAYVQQLSAACTKSGRSAIKLQQYQDIATLFLATSQGRADATINSDTLSRDALKQFSGKLVGGPYAPDLTFIIGLGVSRKVHNLGPAVAAATAEIQKLGLDEKILVKWGFPASAEVPAKLYGTS
jgi:polar amino acid transport system substrate-binding protein